MNNFKEILKIASAFELVSLGKKKKDWVPTSPSKWSQAQAKAKKKFKVHPSAYSNMWASKEYKKMGGKWKKGKKKNSADDKKYTDRYSLDTLKSWYGEDFHSVIEKDINEVFENEQGKLESHGKKDLDGDGVRTTRDWLKEKWVDVSKKNKDGKHPPCGRSKAKKSNYPKCRPAGEAKKMTKKEKESATSQKRQSERNKKRKGKKPIRDNHKKKD